MKKIISNLASLVLLPVILAGFVWECARQSWVLGTDFADAFADWLNRK